MEVLLEQYFRSIEVFAGNKIALKEVESTFERPRKSEPAQLTDRGGTGYH